MAEPTINTLFVNARWPIMVGTTPIAALVAQPQTSTSYADAVRTAQAAPERFETALFRAWVLRHVEARDAAGTPVPYTEADYLGWPAPYAFGLLDFHRAADVPAGSA